MSLSLAPVTSRVIRKLFGWRELEESADRTVTVSAAETFGLPEAIFLPGQIERITGTHATHDSVEHEIERTLESRMANVESKAFRVKDAVVGGNRVSTWKSYLNISLRQTRASPIRIGERLGSGALCSTWQGNDYFAHFLFDDAAAHDLAIRFAEPFFSGSGAPRTPHCVDYLAKLGFPYRERNDVLVDELWFFRDFALGPDKRRRLQNMAARIKAATPSADPKPGAFIRRGVTGQVRTLENAAEVEAWCVDQGFVIVDPERQSVTEICAALKDVPIVIGVEGSHLVHGLFTMAEGGVMICIQPADRFNVIFRQLCGAVNLNWGFVVADGTVQGFRQDLAELAATVDLARNRLEARKWV